MGSKTKMTVSANFDGTGTREEYLYQRPSQMLDEKEVERRTRPKLPTAIMPKEAEEILIRKLSYPLAEGSREECVRLINEFFDEIHEEIPMELEPVGGYLRDNDGRNTVSASVYGWLLNNGIATIGDLMKVPTESIRRDCQCCGAWDQSGIKMAKDKYVDKRVHQEFLDKKKETPLCS